MANLTSDMEEKKNNEVKIDDFDNATIELFLKAMYGAKIEYTLELLQISNKYTKWTH